MPLAGTNSGRLRNYQQKLQRSQVPTGGRARTLTAATSRETVIHLPARPTSSPCLKDTLVLGSWLGSCGPLEPWEFPGKFINSVSSGSSQPTLVTGQWCW